MQLTFGFALGAAYVLLWPVVDYLLFKWKNRERKKSYKAEYLARPVSAPPPQPKTAIPVKLYTEYITASSPILTVTYTPEPYKGTSTAFCYIDRNYDDVYLIDVATHKIENFKATVGKTYCVQYQRHINRSYTSRLSDYCFDAHTPIYINSVPVPPVKPAKTEGYWTFADTYEIKPISCACGGELLFCELSGQSMQLHCHDCGARWILRYPYGSLGYPKGKPVFTLREDYGKFSIKAEANNTVIDGGYVSALEKCLSVDSLLIEVNHLKSVPYYHCGNGKEDET